MTGSRGGICFPTQPEALPCAQVDFTVHDHPPFNLIAILTRHPNSCPSLLDAFFSHTESVCVCVRGGLCVLKAPNETLSEPQPVPLAKIMTTLLRAIERRQKKIAMCFPNTLWALRQKEQNERSEITIWHFSGRAKGEVFYFI